MVATKRYPERDAHFPEVPRRDRSRHAPADAENGPSADDVPSCPACGGTPDREAGVTFLRDGYTFGARCDSCARAPIGGSGRRERNLTRPEFGGYTPAVARAIVSGELDLSDAPRGKRGLWAARSLSYNDTGCITLEKFLGPDGSAISKGYLARLSLPPEGSAWDLERVFIKQSSHSRSRNGNELKEYELSDLADGIYEGDTMGSRGERKRVYFRVEGGRIAVVYRAKADAKTGLAVRA